MNQQSKERIRKVLAKMEEIPNRYPKRTPKEEQPAFRARVLASWAKWQTTRARWLREDRPDLVQAVEGSRQFKQFARIRDRWRDRSRQFKQRYQAGKTGVVDKAALLESLERRQHALQAAWIRARISAIQLEARAGAVAQAPGGKGRIPSAHLGGEAMLAMQRCEAIEAKLWNLECWYWDLPRGRRPAQSWYWFYGGDPRDGMYKGLMAELETIAQRRAGSGGRDDDGSDWMDSYDPSDHIDDEPDEPEPDEDHEPEEDDHDASGDEFDDEEDDDEEDDDDYY